MRTVTSAADNKRRCYSMHWEDSYMGIIQVGCLRCASNAAAVKTGFARRQTGWNICQKFCASHQADQKLSLISLLVASIPMRCSEIERIQPAIRLQPAPKLHQFLEAETVMGERDELDFHPIFD